MRKHIVSLLFILLAFLVGRASNPRTVKAQVPANAATIVGGGPVSTCAKPATGLVFLCVGTDDIIASKNGSVPISVFSVPVAVGVTSWNGQTGNVVYAPPAPPVNSVNGKTGAVILGIQ